MIDWSRVDDLRREVGEEDFPEVVEIFLEEVDELFGRLPISAGNGTLPEDLHFLKGSAASLGFEDLSRLCEKGEIECADGRPPSVLVDGLRTCYLSEKAEFLNRLNTVTA